MLLGSPPPEGADGKSGQRNVVTFGSSVSAPGGTNKSYSFKDFDSGNWFVKSGGRKRKSFYPFLPSSICPMEANLENKDINIQFSPETCNKCSSGDEIRRSDGQSPLPLRSCSRASYGMPGTGGAKKKVKFSDGTVPEHDQTLTAGLETGHFDRYRRNPKPSIHHCNPHRNWLECPSRLEIKYAKALPEIWHQIQMLFAVHVANVLAGGGRCCI